MTDSNNKTGKKPLTLSSKGTLELKKSVDGQDKIRQNFTHGRSKSVTVEVRKKRNIIAGENSKDDALVIDDEKAHKIKLVQDAQRLREEEDAKRLKEEQEQKEREEKRLQAEEEARKLQAEIELSSQKEAAKVAETTAGAEEKKEDKAPVVEVPTVENIDDADKAEKEKFKAKEIGKKRPFDESDDADDDSNKDKASKMKITKKVVGEKRRSGKITISSVINDDFQDERERSLASLKRARRKEKMKQEKKPLEKVIREVVIPETMTVQELANRMSERGAVVIKSLMGMGVMATINQVIDADTAQLVVEELGHKFKRVSDADVEDSLIQMEDTEENTESRSPVVTVMGHVDHGKTKLLDAFRSTNVAEGEAGGITQHIGAYQVKIPTGEKITFIDTPGHAAFTAMRARGAKVTDIVVLVVAANDGIMPQTIEAIRHAKAAEVPIVVAINKIDLPAANPAKVKNDLLQEGLVVEEMGGDVLCVEISAKQKINLDKLLEAIVLQSEILALKANYKRPANGVVIEAKMDKGRGSVATILVQGGTLRVGDIFVTGKEWGKVRALVNETGQSIKQVIPSQPVEVVGLQGTPQAGDDFIVVTEGEAKAREISLYRQRKEREASMVKSARSTMDQMLARIKAGETKEVAVLIKGDVQGSIEALTGVLNDLSNDEVKINILHSAVGGINESDVTLARASNAIIIGFNVRANPQARSLARRDAVDIRYYSIIYDVVDDIKRALESKLTPELKENIIGYAEIREVFNITKTGKVAGCMISEGTVKRGAKVRLLRNDVVIHDGVLSQLKRFKDDVREVREGYECGMSFENYNDIQKGDFIECYEIEEIAAKLS
ncbi:MAG: translation initiation factor IF-2 [Alphaproteobacteria bacterium]